MLQKLAEAWSNLELGQSRRRGPEAELPRPCDPSLLPDIVTSMSFILAFFVILKCKI